MGSRSQSVGCHACNILMGIRNRSVDALMRQLFSSSRSLAYSKQPHLQMAVCKARRSLVQKIRAIAKRHNVPVVPDTASAARVEAMHHQVLECAGLTKRDRALAEDAFAEYATLR